ncbi:TMP-TENI-domain-containing protein [Durotheca rogersii]|uniref:TMP-TENI-domain-containing protein n=1 Tax=Durotheca rogersii TaxID=419775 RepID=UPI00221ED896|nr:TMP-TENI-domain-containing protein [Durotheca rogersii]KAI5863111.1 TMP-TENI-domain-containing protein [Durotheca rogersii]
MDVKQMQMIQNNHAERLSRLEKRQADDAAIKSVWNSPFPSALGGTPQHGPLQMPSNELFDEFEEQGQSLLGSLHLDAEDEPARRGAASRANSVRFDESALQSSSWAQNGRHSSDFGPIRPGSGLGMMERSLSHKSDGRHSSAGHSVHSIHSHHSVASGRGSSLGLDTTFAPGGQGEGSPIGVPEPPPSLFVLGSVPSIIRCWLTASFAHDTLLYADVCTGSQKSIIELSLVKDLDLAGEIHRDLDGVHRIRLPVYLTEATISQPSPPRINPAPQMPSVACTFEVVGMDQPDNAEARKTIRVFIGSEVLREHSADILFSQNRMTLYSGEREKLSVPFVRPEDNTVFKNIRTMATFPEKPKLNATARPFVLGEPKQQVPAAAQSDGAQTKESCDDEETRELASPSSEQTSQQAATAGASTLSESGGESERHYQEAGPLDPTTREFQPQHEGSEADEAGHIVLGANGSGLRAGLSTEKQQVDYSLYLVTDSTPAILGDADICEVVEAALKGGVTCVQYRDKTSDTRVLVSTARKLHQITKKYNVPLLVNDRVDVALAVGCEGVHIGQDDLDLPTARRLLGQDAIIGITVSNVDEATIASQGGADYLGIGTVFATATKENTKSIIGVLGLQEILSAIAAAEWPVKTVCIGGINASNVSRVVWQSTVSGKSLDGVAVVSAIVAARDPEAASKELLRLVKTPPAFARTEVTRGQQTRPLREIIALVPDVIAAVERKTPLSHNMTNLVVQNFAANVALSVGASPIMANYGKEAKDLAKLGGALVINMGSVTPDGLANYLQALKAYNDAGQPVVFDPVGAGATAIRRSAARAILDGGYIDVIKGNRSEILSCLPGESQVQQRGVDSGPSNASLEELGRAARRLARLRRCVVVMTGKTDLVTAGETVYAIDNGHEYLGMVSGTGCCLGTTISAMIAAYPEDKLAATLTGLLLYTIAAEYAARRPDVQGPGTFSPAFIDELYNVRKGAVKDHQLWPYRVDTLGPEGTV